MITSLSGNWHYSTDDRSEFATSGFDDSAWANMSIPRNWFLSGLDHHGVVWFRYEFEFPGLTDDLPFSSLHFDGVDYFCDVHLNGEHLGRHEGYFEPFVFDVTKVLKPGKNVLAVRVDSPYETPGPNGWHMRKKLIKGVLNHHDARPGGGWEATGQSYNTGGIWNRVFIRTHGAVTVEAVLLRAELEGESPGLRAEVRLKNRSSKQKTSLQLECVPENFKGQGYAARAKVEIPKGESVHHIELKTPDVKHWQPWDLGFSFLYAVSVNVLNSTSTTLFGFRSVQVDENYQWTVNGQRYFVRGSNYLASQWLAELLFPEITFEKNHPFGGRRDAAPFKTDVELMKQANLNMIRVHAHVLPREFHEACDRAGIMVWQDFPLQWGYSDEPAFHTEAERQARAMIEMLYNHPSIVTWCMHNESPWSAHWMAELKDETYDQAQNHALDERLQKAGQQADPTRHVHINSGTGDGHAYPGWYETHWREYARLPGSPFCTEYGAQALPVKQSLLDTFKEWGPDAGYAELVKLKNWLAEPYEARGTRRLLIQLRPGLYSVANRLGLKGVKSWLNGLDVKPVTSPYRNIHEREGGIPTELKHAYDIWQSWRFHNFQPPETFEPGRVETGKTLDEFIASSHSYQNNIIQYATENYRRAKFAPVSGIFQFDLTDPWPAITWSVLDYWRRPKPSFDVLRRSMQPVLPTFDLPLYVEIGRKIRTHLMVVNDVTEAFLGTTISWTVNYGKKRITDGEWQLDVPANAVSESKPVTWWFKKRGDYCVTVSIRSADGKLLGENVYEVKATQRPV
jgi:beta-mannosidase